MDPGISSQMKEDSKTADEKISSTYALSSFAAMDEENFKNQASKAKDVLQLTEALYVAIKRDSARAAEKYLLKAKGLGVFKEVCALRPVEKEGWLSVIDKDDNQYGLYEPIARNKNINVIEAIKKNRLDILQLMKNHGLDFQTCLKKYMMTPIEAAARWGHVEAVEFLLEAGEDIDHKNVLYQTPLYTCLQYKQINVLKFLLEKKAKTSIRDAFGQTPVMFFLMQCGCRTDADLVILRCLLEGGAAVNIGDTVLLPLHAAICKSEVPDKAVQILLKYVPDIDAKCSGGWSALHFCCATNNDVMFIEELDKAMRCKILKLLLENAADPNVADDKYETPLHVAARNGFAKASEILVEFGADPLLRDIDGNRPIEYSQPQSGVWYVLRSAIKEKRASGSGRNTPSKNSPTLPNSASRVFFPDKDEVDSPVLSDSMEHESIGVMTTTPCNPREEAWQDVTDKINKLQSSFESKDKNILLHELGLLKQSLSNLKGQEDYIFSQIWPSGYPMTKPSQGPSSAPSKSPPRSGPVVKLKIDLVDPIEFSNGESDMSYEEMFEVEKVFFKGCRIAADLLGLDWKMVFRDLEVYDPLKAEIIIKEIEQKNPGQLREQSYQALLNWKQIKGRDATLPILLKHLKECSLQNVAQTIQDKLA